MKVVVNELIPVYETDKGERVVIGRELHEFLEVSSKFADWIKNRIAKYGFEEDQDYTTISNNLENGGRSIDYILKLDIAKEIAMVESNEQGSNARKYFIEVEKRFKQKDIDTTGLSPQLQMFKQLWDGLAQKEIADARRDKDIKVLQESVTTIKETIISRDDDWRSGINKMFNNAALHTENRDFQALRNESYKLLEERAHCDLDKRLRNLVDRLKQNGATKTQINKTTKLDVIEHDPRLKEIYTSIVKELSVRHVRIGA